MVLDPVAFCRERMPELYAATVASLERRKGDGDQAAAARLSEIRSSPMAAVLRFSGDSGGALYLVADGHSLSVLDSAPAQPGVFYAVTLSEGAARYGIARFERGEVPAERAGRALSVLGSAKARELFAATAYAFDLEILDIPVLGDAHISVALGLGDHPPRPEFSLTLDYDEIEDAAEQDIGPHQLFMSGKIRIDGDAAKAMMLGMTLAQLR